MTPNQSPLEQSLAQKYNLAEEDVNKLRKQGILLPDIPHELGEGLTRNVYFVKYKVGEIERDMALKVPKEVEPEDSVIGFINTSRRDVNIHEARLHNRLKGHPRIIPVLGTIKTKDGRTVTFEDYQKGSMSLEDMIERYGPLRDMEQAEKFISQFLEPNLYLKREGIFHRDIKPSNVLMTDDGPVLTDFQNAAFPYGSLRKIQPTRGGAAYSTPKINNRWVKGLETEYAEEDEVYSIAATVLYALSGKNLGYKIQTDLNGETIEVNGRKFGIKLTADEKTLEEITNAEHARRVKNAIREIKDPAVRKRYGKMIERCLIPDHKKPINSRYNLSDEFDKINSSVSRRIKEGMVTGSKYVLPTLAASVMASLLAFGIANYDKEGKPSMSEILSTRAYKEFSLDNLSPNEKEFAYPVLVPYMKKAQEKLPELEESGALENMDRYVQGFAHDIHRIPQRLTSSWIRACYLNQDLTEQFEKENRLAPSFVPKEFIERSELYRPLELKDDDRKIIRGILYLKYCLGPGTIEDVLANYFASNIDIKSAIAASNSISYLPNIHENTIGKGYYTRLPYHQSELISTALALYMITDEQGKVHYDWIPDIVPRFSSISTEWQSCTIVKDIETKKAESMQAAQEK